MQIEDDDSYIRNRMSVTQVLELLVAEDFEDRRSEIAEYINLHSGVFIETLDQIFGDECLNQVDVKGRILELVDLLSITSAQELLQRAIQDDDIRIRAQFNYTPDTDQIYTLVCPDPLPAGLSDCYEEDIRW